MFSERPRPRPSCECELASTNRQSWTLSVDETVVEADKLSRKRRRSQRSHEDEVPMDEPLRKRRRVVERGSNFF